MTNAISEVAETDFIMAVGTNTVEAHPVISYKINQALRKGAQLVVIDPRDTDLAKWANEHLQLKSGTDIALFNGMINVIISEDLWNKEFVDNRTEGFDDLKATVTKYTPEYVEGITGIPAAKIRSVARAYAKADKASILYTMGITQHTVGTHNVFSVANLAMLCGHIGRKFTGVNPLRGQNNVQGACDMGALPNVLTAYQSVTDPAAREKFGKAWNCTIGEKPGLTVGEMITAAHHGDLKAMYIMGENPMLSDPDASHVAHALEHLDFLVVQDIFLTETAQFADVVLPAASYAEKDGTFSNTERRVQRIRKAVPPPGIALPDWEIISRVAAAMGYPMNYASPLEIFDEMRSVTPSYAGITYARIEEKGIQWPCPTCDHPGTQVLHGEKFSRGLGKFNAVEHVDPDETTDAEYPLILDTGRRLYHYHTGTMTRKGMLDEQMPSDYLEINCADAESLGVCDGDKVKVISRRGAMEISAQISEVVPRGLVFTSFHFAETPVNRLTNPKFDPIAKIPELKVCAVRVEKIA
jgi:formate dehydrogenase alpha subunit